MFNSLILMMIKTVQKHTLTLKKDKESDYSYRMNSEGKAYQYSCSNGKCMYKENSVRRYAPNTISLYT